MIRNLLIVLSKRVADVERVSWDPMASFLLYSEL